MKLFVYLGILLIVVGFGRIPTTSAAPTNNFLVNSTADTHDPQPGNGRCGVTVFPSGENICSLRAAIEEANALSGHNTITFEEGVHVALTIGRINITEEVTIIGNIEGVFATTEIDAQYAAEEVFVVDAPSLVTMELLTLTATGHSDDVSNSAHMGCITSQSDLRLKGVKVLACSGHFGCITHLKSILYLDGVTISGCTGQQAGGIYAAESASSSVFLSIKNSAIIGNTSKLSGGGINCVGALCGFEIVDSNIIGNMAGNGGGISRFTTVLDSPSGALSNIKGTTIKDNTAARGAGIYVTNAYLVIESSTVVGNTSIGQNSLWGGGLHAASGSAAARFLVKVINSTFSGNSAEWGGAILNFGSNVELIHVTVTKNSSTESAVYLGLSGEYKIYNSIIGDQTGGDDCNFQADDSSGNVDSDSSCGSGFLTSTLINLQPLANNGGRTQTHLPNVISITLNNADTGICPFYPQDQRGFLRPPVGEPCDIGAVELNGTPLAVHVSNQDAKVSNIYFLLLIAIGLTTGEALLRRRTFPKRRWRS